MRHDLWTPSGEPERYELFATSVPEGASESTDGERPLPVTRRQFCQALGAGVLVLLLREVRAVQESGGGRRAEIPSMPREISAWLHIANDGRVTVYTGKVEVGQNIRTSLTQVVAEELRVPMERIHLVMGDTDLTPFDLGTFGSRTTPVMAAHLRRVAAATRELLRDLAAERWKVERWAVEIAEGKVRHPASGRSQDIGELTRGQKLSRPIPDTVTLTPPTEWRIIGTSAPKVNGRAFVTGEHRYTSDLKLPGMLYGKVLRPPAFGATLVSVDTREAEAMPGVIVVRDGDFVGVAAPSTEQATRALVAIRAQWKTTPQPSSREIFEYLKKNEIEAEGRSRYVVGSLEDGWRLAEKQWQQTYTVAYIAHAPLEPRAAVAEWKDGRLTVWTGTQRPFGVRSELARAFGLPEDRVRVIVPDTGSGYGGKHTGEAAIEAARLARAAGRPVKVVWTREEEFTWAYFRPAGVIEVRSGMKGDGTITAWEFHTYNSGAAAIRTPYAIPNQWIEFHPTRSPLRQGSYRALAATANHFARETAMDELAHLVGIDPLEFRLKNLKDERLRAVLEAAAHRFGWGKPKTAPDRGMGLAAGFEKGGYVATCAEIAVDRATGEVSVLRVVTAFECGAILNPDHLKNQIEGALVMGLGGALFEAIEFENGKILNPRFSRYRVPRFSDLPQIDVVLLDRRDLPSAGAGETPIVGIAPAIGNAIFHATGMRLRSLPLAPNGLKGETRLP
ncbi:Nicotinate dehydrogenase subunit B [bacterium HR08]|nr:Nicotinate dehydrogenase subunit B [bacterium HR08]